MGHHSHDIEVTSTSPYEFKSRNRMIAIAMIVIGIIAIVAQFITHHEQTWGNLLMNNFLLLDFTLGATFFLALQYVAEVSWSTVIKRPMEALGLVLPVVGIIMLVIIFFGGSHLYHWMDATLTDPKSPNFDKVIEGKSAYLNTPFFWIRAILYFVIWTYGIKLMRKNSLLMNESNSKEVWIKTRRFACGFLVLFAVTESTMAWDFIMSLDAHWFSTLFGWYAFSGIFITSLVGITFTVTYLKSKGYLAEVNNNHLQDLGKFIFAFSIFWTYLWFCQFMLIWYANLPEEVTYFMIRQDHYRGLWLGSFFINFICPFIILMSRDAKRKPRLIMAMCILLFIGHWMDTYIMVIPGAMVTASHHLGEGHPQIYGTITWMEIGTTIGFLGLLIYLVQHNLSKAPLVIKNDPLMNESLHHAI